MSFYVIPEEIHVTKVHNYNYLAQDGHLERSCIYYLLYKYQVYTYIWNNIFWKKKKKTLKLGGKLFILGKQEGDIKLGRRG